MANVNDTDTFLVNRSNSSYQLQAQNLMAELLDDDLMLVNRSNVTYKATGADIKASLKPPAEVIKPQIIAPADGAGQTVGPKTDEIIDVVLGSTRPAIVLDAIGASGTTIRGYVNGGNLLGDSSNVTNVVRWVNNDFKNAPYYSDNLNDSAKLGNNGLQIGTPDGVTSWIEFSYSNGPAVIEVVYGNSSESVSGQEELFGIVTGDATADLRAIDDSNKNELPKHRGVITLTKESGTFRVTAGKRGDPNGSQAPFWHFIDLDPSPADVLTLDGTKNFSKFTVGDFVEQDDNNAFGVLSFIDTANAQMHVNTKSGAWSANTGNYVVGPEVADPNAPDPSGVNFVGSTFASSDGSLTAGSADWQVAALADTGYTSPISQVTGHPEMGPPPTWTSDELEGATEYRARTKYKAASGEESPWSDDVTFKTGLAEDPRADIEAVPGYLHGYNLQAAPTKSVSPVKFVNWTAGTHFVGVGVDGAGYIGPRYDQWVNGGSWVRNSSLSPSTNDLVDVFVPYARDPLLLNNTVLLCRDGNLHKSRNGWASPLATNINRLLKLGGVSRIVMAETNDGKLYGVDVDEHASLRYIVDKELNKGVATPIQIGLPADDDDLKMVAGATGNYDAQAIVVLTEAGNLYYCSNTAGAILAELGLPRRGDLPLATPLLLTDGAWGDIQGQVSAIGNLSDGYGGSAGIWVRLKNKDLYIASGAGSTQTNGPTNGLVKVAENAISGAMGAYFATEAVWFFVDADGFAWDAQRSLNPTKNTAAGAIFAEQGTGYSSFNYNGAGMNSMPPCIIDI